MEIIPICYSEGADYEKDTGYYDIIPKYEFDGLG
jgi:hypothetical protein